MTLRDFDEWARALLDPDSLASVDDSLNGIQVSRPEGELERVAFAVDASLETMRRAVEAGARLLFVHHGIFWGKPLRVEGFHRERLKLLLDSDLALYASHLPLDRHPVVGNNAVLAGLLGLEDLEPFGSYHGVKIGWKGAFPRPLKLEEAVARILPDGTPPNCVLPCGPETIRTAAVVSGGAAFEVSQAIDEGVDLYVTGEASHSIYGAAVEGRINFVAAGHYRTEVHGVRAVAERLERETGLSTVFVDLPTGL